MRKISANYIFPVTGKPLKNGILIVDKEGTIVDLIDTGGNLKEEENLEFYNGILVPGFINAFCNFEELRTISAHQPEISVNELFSWAIFNGAKALKMDKTLGSFEKGKNPGINLIENFDFKKMRLTGNSTVRSLV